MDLMDKIQNVKRASYDLALLSDTKRNDVLNALAKVLHDNVSSVIEANEKDLRQMDISDPMYDRLLLDAPRTHAMAQDIETVTHLASPIGKVLEHKTMPNGLVIDKVTTPLGLVAVIYESRPNVTIDVFSLCFKSGNACILKGGKEAYNSNAFLVALIQEVLAKHSIHNGAVLLLSTQRNETLTLLKAREFVDVCIPRGSKALIDFVRDNARIPVIETGAGIVHVYFDVEGDTDKGQRIIHNAKTRRVSVCNALDCLVIHKDRLKDIYSLLQPLAETSVEIFADEKAYEALQPYYPSHLLFYAHDDHYGVEFLSYKMAIKTVDSVGDAITHVMEYTSGHSECIITENTHTASYFTERVDAAVVYVNTSTAFTDGAQFGMGAEIGISTQKLHARGPMSLDALTSYKWIVRSDGHTRPV